VYHRYPEFGFRLWISAPVPEAKNGQKFLKMSALGRPATGDFWESAFGEFLRQLHLLYSPFFKNPLKNEIFLSGILGNRGDSRAGGIKV